MKAIKRNGRFRQAYDGDEISLAAGIALKPGTAIYGEIQCCRCGLIHKHRYRITRRGTLKLTTWRVKKIAARKTLDKVA